MLYRTVERACMLAGLDPYAGFTHTDHYNKQSLGGTQWSGKGVLPCRGCRASRGRTLACPGKVG